MIHTRRSASQGKLKYIIVVSYRDGVCVIFHIISYFTPSIICVTYSSRYTFAEPRVHAFVYEPTKGIARKLPVNFTEYIDDLHHIYELYQAVGDKDERNGKGTVLVRGINGANSSVSTYMHDIEAVAQEEEGDA